mmetsp:Transcript_30599/g.90717  ORF Transcript_30599/g.90717 Transcript_30599/m.90717 type:complete len:241 (+) Transcript_30599:839-1561(+)
MPPPTCRSARAPPHHAASCAVKRVAKGDAACSTPHRGRVEPHGAPAAQAMPGFCRPSDARLLPPKRCQAAAGQAVPGCCRPSDARPLPASHAPAHAWDCTYHCQDYIPPFARPRQPFNPVRCLPPAADLVPRISHKCGVVAQALCVLLADDGVLEDSVREIDTLKRGAGDDGVDKLGANHLGTGKVDTVDDAVGQVSARQVGVMCVRLCQHRLLHVRLREVCVRHQRARQDLGAQVAAGV